MALDQHMLLRLRESVDKKLLLKLRRCAAPESVKFALRKLEDLQSTEVAALSLATALSGVSPHVASIKEILRQIHSVLMSAQANWDDDREDAWMVDSDDDSDYNRSVQRKVFSESDRTEKAIVEFLKEVVRMIHAPGPHVFKNTQPVNFLALHEFKGKIMQINPRVQRLNIKDLSKTGRKSITQPPWQFHRNIDENWLLGLELYQKRIVEELVDSSLQTRSVVQSVGTQQFMETRSMVQELGAQQFVKTALARKIYQRYFKSYIQTKFTIS